MSDKPAATPQPPEAAAPAETFYTEEFPSRAGDVSGVASANAPFLYFDQAPFWNLVGGIGMVTLTAVRYLAQKPNGEVPGDFVAVGHLRGSLVAIARLHKALGVILERAEAEAAVAASTAPPTSSVAH